MGFWIFLGTYIPGFLLSARFIAPRFLGYVMDGRVPDAGDRWMARLVGFMLASIWPLLVVLLLACGDMRTTEEKERQIRAREDAVRKQEKLAQDRLLQLERDAGLREPEPEPQWVRPDAVYRRPMSGW